jgi:predicted metal-dependent phosphoesterase TrpH
MAGTIVDMHLHTTSGASDSALTPEQLVAEAHRIGLTGVNISEHDRLWDRHALDKFRETSGLFVNNGMEISTDMGHMIAVGLKTYVPGIRHAQKLREELDKVGGFLIVAHPFRHFFDPVHYMRQGKKPVFLTLDEACELPVFKVVDAIEVLNGGSMPRENKFALAVARRLGIKMTGGSDAHSTSGIACFSTQFEKELHTEAELLEELHAGRCYPIEGLNLGQQIPYGQVGNELDAEAAAAPAS